MDPIWDWKLLLRFVKAKCIYEHRALSWIYPLLLKQSDS